MLIVRLRHKSKEMFGHQNHRHPVFNFIGISSIHRIDRLRRGVQAIAFTISLTTCYTPSLDFAATRSVKIGECSRICSILIPCKIGKIDSITLVCAYGIQVGPTSHISLKPIARALF